jgi:hypothetical protein
MSIQQEVEDKLSSTASLLRAVASSLEEASVSVSQFSLPTEDILDLLIDLGLLLSYQDQLILPVENQEVFEDPYDRPDSLGNVRMIYKRPQLGLLFSERIAQFGEKVAEGAVELSQQIHSSQKVKRDYDQEEEFLDQLFRQVDPLDLPDMSGSDEIKVQLESRQRTKALLGRFEKRILSLRRELRKQSRYNRKLSSQLEAKKDLISSLHKRLRSFNKKRR